MTKKILQVLGGGVSEVPPVWMMRQAGRYLPEYRELRAKAGSFLGLVYDPVAAAEVTVQPVRRFGMDAAILFADILVLPHALGVDVRFETGEGPVLTPTISREAVDALGVDRGVWAPVIETVKQTRAQLVREGFADTTLIGFAGAPWTIACYMVCGSGKDHDFTAARHAAYAQSEFFDALIDRITQATIDYLSDQITAGAEAVQIFDSWAGVAGGVLFDRYVVAPTVKIVSALRMKHPGTPIIGFPRLAGNRLAAYVRATGVNGVGVDTVTDLGQARADVPGVCLQGNLDPVVLMAGGDALDRAVDGIISDMAGAPHIFNLGHGVMPATPPEHVAQVVNRIRKTG